MLLEMLVRLVFGLVTWPTRWSDAKRERRARRLAEIDRVNAWLRTQPNSNRPTQEERAP